MRTKTAAATTKQHTIIAQRDNDLFVKLKLEDEKRSKDEKKVNNTSPNS